jgi:hypothetical protein
MERLISRAEARNKGLTRYFTGMPCKWGHVAPRLVSINHCIQCATIRDRKRRRKNPARYRNLERDWRSRNLARVYAIDRRRYGEKRRLENSAWKRHNPSRRRANEASRRALKKSQRCTCCTDEQIYRAFYAMVRPGIEVDHVKPLRAGGLHCIRNLQLLAVEAHRLKTARENPERAAMARSVRA